MTSRELRQQRAQLVAKAREIPAAATAHTREMSAEEVEQVNTIMARVDELDARIAALERLESAEAEGEAPTGTQAGGGESEQERELRRSGRTRERGEDRDPLASEEYRTHYREYIRTGRTRAQTVHTGSEGGYLLPPVQLSRDFIVALNNLVFVRQLADIEPVENAVSLGVPTLVTDVSDPEWASEVPAEDIAAASLVFGRRELEPKFLPKLVKVSDKLLMQSTNIEKIINDRLAYKFAVAQENNFLNGDGSGKPLGVFVANDNGVPTSRDHVTASTTDFTLDDVIEMVGLIPEQYVSSPSFCIVMHRTIATKARLKKDGNGQYLWRDSIEQGRPSTLNGIPVRVSEYAPNTLTAAKYIMLAGDFRYYKIAETSTYRIQRLLERMALTNEVGFLGRHYADGMPVLSTAFARMKTKAS